MEVYEVETLEDMIIDGQPRKKVTVATTSFDEAERLVLSKYPDITIKVISRVRQAHED